MFGNPVLQTQLSRIKTRENCAMRRTSLAKSIRSTRSMNPASIPFPIFAYSRVHYPYIHKFMHPPLLFTIEHVLRLVKAWSFYLLTPIISQYKRNYLRAYFPEVASKTSLFYPPVSRRQHT